METVYTLATKLYEALETKERDNGDKFSCLKDGSPKWMTEVIRAVHGEKLPDDTTYSMIEAAASAIADGGDSDNTAEDSIAELEPDVYTAGLTKWLASRADHVYYLTEALEQFEPKDGFALLAQAQKIQMDEIGFALIHELEKQVAEQEETEEA